MHGRSELLRAFEQLDYETLSAVLLPGLSSTEDTANLSQSCKQLRDLCLKNYTQLNFKWLYKIQPKHLAKVPQLFPACSAATCSVNTKEDTSFHLPGLISALAQLPNFTSLDIRATTAGASQTQLLALLLEVIRLQLPRLQALRIQVNAGWDRAPELWSFVARQQSMKQLVIKFEPGVADPIKVQHLEPLANLQHLQSLSIEGTFKEWQDYTSLGSLTGLTKLSLHLARRCTSLHNIRKCTNLQHLSLVPSSIVKLRMDLADLHHDIDLSLLHKPEMDALINLKKLTHLNLLGHVWKPEEQVQEYHSLGSCDMFLQTISHHTQLQELLVDGWMATTAVPLLLHLTNLTCLSGSWEKDVREEVPAPWPPVPHGMQQGEDAAEQPAGVAAATVRFAGSPATNILQLTLSGNFTEIPINVFSKVTSLTCLDPILVQDLWTITEHCTKLQRLTLGTNYVRKLPIGIPPIGGNIPLVNTSLSLPSHLVKNSEAVAAMPKACADAIGSLSRCSSLTYLHFGAKFDTDIPMLNELKQVRELALSVPGSGSCVTMRGLMRLGYQRHLRVLKLAVPEGRFKTPDAKLFLQTVHYVPEVWVTAGWRYASWSPFPNAKEQLKREGMLLPAVCTVV